MNAYYDTARQAKVLTTSQQYSKPGMGKSKSTHCASLGEMQRPVAVPWRGKRVQLFVAFPDKR